MADLKTIAAIVGVVTGIGGPIAGYFVGEARLETRLEERLTTLTDTSKGYRTELNGMHERENTLALGLVNDQNSITLARSEILGKLDVVNANLQHVRETLDEVRGDQRKHPASLSGNGTSQ